MEIATRFALRRYLLFHRVKAEDGLSVGVPSVKRNMIGFQSPFRSSVVFTTLLSMSSIKKSSAPPSDVPPPIGNTGG